MTDIRLRDATTGDAEAISAIYNPYVEKTIITFEQNPVTAAEMAARVENVRATYPWLVCEAAGRVMGYAYATRWRTRAAYDHTAETTVYLAEKATGQGLGYKLYMALLQALRTSGIHAALGCIALPNDASIALHEKCGFRKVAHFSQVGRKFDRWVDVGFWQLLF